MKCNRVSTSVMEKFKWTFWPTQYFDVVLFIFAFLVYAFEAISKNASESMIVAQCKPLPDSSVHEILQARILGWVATSSSRESSWLRDQTKVSCCRQKKKFCLLGFSIMQTKNFQLSKLDLEKEKEPEIKLQTFSGSQRKLGNSRKHLPLFHQLHQRFWLYGS